MSVSAAARVVASGVVVRHPVPWLLAWALALVLARLWLSPALELDEAEQMLWSQRLAWGYGAQPPLYTWLQSGVAALLGPGLLALAVLKMALLALTYWCLWRAAREVLPPRAAWWASASLVWLPIMGWESLRDLTHTVLVCASVAATWWLVLRQLQRPQPSGFVALGLVLALGLLSKYSFALFALALVLAVLSGRETRLALWTHGWWYLPLTLAAVLLPHALWLWQHWQLASRGTLTKLQLQPEASVLQGLSSLLVDGVLANLLLWLLLALAVFGRTWWRPLPLQGDAAAQAPAHAHEPAPPAWLQPLLWRYLGWVAVLLLGMVLVGDVTHFKARWVHPLLLVVPLLAFVARPVLAHHPRSHWFTSGVVLGFVLFGALFVARPWLNGRLDRLNEINEPIAELVQHLQRAGYDGQSPILASDAVLGGMLRAQFPTAPVAVCRPEPLADLPACVAQARAFWADGDGAAVTGPRSVLLVARQADPVAAWWRALGPLPRGAAVQTLYLPYTHAPASALPVRYQFVWPSAPLHP